MRLRDEVDANRDVAPLRPAQDAVIVTSEGKSPEVVLKEVLTIIQEKRITGQADKVS